MDHGQLHQNLMRELVELEEAYRGIRGQQNSILARITEVKTKMAEVEGMLRSGVQTTPRVSKSSRVAGHVQ